MASCLVDTEEKSNGTKLSRLLVDGGTEALRNTFDGIHPPSSLAADLHSQLPILTHLRQKRVLNSNQWDKLFPSSGEAPDSRQFDITLLYVLLRDICGLTPPATGWDNLPLATDSTPEANLARIKYYRNQVYGHISSTSIEEAEFEMYWKEISNALIALGLDQISISLLKSSPLGTMDYTKLLEEWAVEGQCVKEVAEKARKAASIATAETRKTRNVAEKAIKIVEDIKIEAERTGNTVESLKNEFIELKKTAELKGIEPLRDRSLLSKLAKCDFTGHVKALCSYCYPGTRTWVLNDLQQFVCSKQERVVAVTARPGVGKSVLAAVTCQIMHEQGKLAACHFIEHNNSLRNNPKLIIESLASHLCDSIVGFEQKLEERLSRNVGKELSNMSCKELFTLLIEEPMNAVEKPSSIALVVIDALDEIEQSTKDEFAKALFHVIPKLPEWMKLVVTTRPTPSVIPKLSFVTVIDIDKGRTNNIEDIKLFLQDHLCQIYHETTLEELQTAASTLANISDGIFLFAHFAIDITKVTKPSFSQVHRQFPNGISSVYEEYFSRLVKDLPVEEDKFFYFLETLVTADGRLPKAFALQILEVSGSSRQAKKTAREVLSCLSHLFPVHNEHITVFHKSLLEWLLGSEHEEHSFSVRKNDGHRVLAPLCFQHLRSIKDYENFPPAMNDCEKYALRFGFRHMLEAGGYKEQLKMCVTDLELLSAMLTVSFGGAMWNLLDELKDILHALNWKSQQLEEFITELTYFGDIFCTNYTQAILQAATNCPETNELRKQSLQLLSTPKYNRLPWIEFVQPACWELPRDVHFVDDFKLSADTKKAICIGEMSNNQSFVATFNTETRRCTVDAAIEEVTFHCAISPIDDCTVAAITTDCGVKLIDLESLQTLEVFKADSLPFSCCFLSVGTQLAVGYRDCAVRVWDLKTATTKTQLIGHTGFVILCLPLSGGRLLTGDWSGTLLLWQSLGPSPRVIKLTDCCWSRDWSNNKETAAVSPDKTKIAALCRSELTPYGSCVVNLYSAEDGKLVMQLMEGNRCAVSFVDNSHVLCGEVHELQVMNINSGETRKRLCCPRQLHLRSSPHRVTTMEFVASFQSPSHDGEKLMGFRLHNIS